VILYKLSALGESESGREKYLTQFRLLYRSGLRETSSFLFLNVDYYYPSPRPLCLLSKNKNQNQKATTTNYVTAQNKCLWGCVYGCVIERGRERERKRENPQIFELLNNIKPVSPMNKQGKPTVQVHNTYMITVRQVNRTKTHHLQESHQHTLSINICYLSLADNISQQGVLANSLAGYSLPIRPRLDSHLHVP
jgi:hypothetical protein